MPSCVGSQLAVMQSVRDVLRQSPFATRLRTSALDAIRARYAEAKRELILCLERCGLDAIRAGCAEAKAVADVTLA